MQTIYTVYIYYTYNLSSTEKYPEPPDSDLAAAARTLAWPAASVMAGVWIENDLFVL
jgi:hypothetical protein